MSRNNLLKTTSIVPLHQFFEGEDNQDEPKPFDLQSVLSNPDQKAIVVEWAERELVAGVKTKNEEILGKLTKYKESDDDGTGKPKYYDPEEVRNAVAHYRNRGDADKDVEERINSALEGAKAEFTRENEALANKASEFEQKFAQEQSARHNLMVEGKLQNALLDSGIKPGKLPLHQMFLEQYITIETDSDGKETVVVLDENKDKIRYGTNGAMTVPEFIAEYSEREGIAEDWDPNYTGGSGTENGPGKKGPRNRVSNAIDPSLPPGERLRLHRQSEGAKRR